MSDRIDVSKFEKHVPQDRIDEIRANSGVAAMRLLWGNYKDESGVVSDDIRSMDIDSLVLKNRIEKKGDSAAVASMEKRLRELVRPTEEGGKRFSVLARALSGGKHDKWSEFDRDEEGLAVAYLLQWLDAAYGEPVYVPVDDFLDNPTTYDSFAALPYSSEPQEPITPSWSPVFSTPTTTIPLSAPQHPTDSPVSESLVDDRIDSDDYDSLARQYLDDYLSDNEEAKSIFEDSNLSGDETYRRLISEVIVDLHNKHAGSDSKFANKELPKYKSELFARCVEKEASSKEREHIAAYLQRNHLLIKNDDELGRLSLTSDGRKAIKDFLDKQRGGATVDSFLSWVINPQQDTTNSEIIDGDAGTFPQQQNTQSPIALTGSQLFRVAFKRGRGLDKPDSSDPLTSQQSDGNFGIADSQPSTKRQLKSILDTAIRNQEISPGDENRKQLVEAARQIANSGLFRVRERQKLSKRVAKALGQYDSVSR